MRDPEYDRFGPWILEISEEDPVPPVFVPYIIREETPLLSLKIPVPVERRDLKPGDSMYDYLVSLYSDDMEILVRDGGEAVRFTIRYQSIMSLRNLEDLLDGHLVVYTPEITYDLPYNTVSVDLIRKMIDLIRRRYAPPTDAEYSLEFESPNTEHLGFLFQGLVQAREAENIPGRLFALQTEQRMVDIDTRFLHKVFYRTVDKRLLETIHYITDRELEVLGHGRTWAYRWHAVYGKETLYIPLSRLRGADEEDHPSNPGMAILSLITDISRHPFVFSQDNPAIERYRSLISLKRSVPSAGAS